MQKTWCSLLLGACPFGSVMRYMLQGQARKLATALQIGKKPLHRAITEKPSSELDLAQK